MRLCKTNARYLDENSLHPSLDHLMQKFPLISLPQETQSNQI